MSEHTNIAKLRAAERRIWSAKANYTALIAATFHPGMIVHYRHGLAWRAARVCERTSSPGSCTGTDCVWVEGITGRRYWIDTARVKEITGE
jgi:hypothetical protein